ncbi:oxidoreductase [Microlunatus sp. GCM10028923]|uniref:oxidoreductase n=1 Tax=Microlunatus sp. GCM10028923 TaxID=3273400 RepID=UPI003622D76E
MSEPRQSTVSAVVTRPKVCLITGASSGIGHATALELLRAGHTVYGAARRQQLMIDLERAGGAALPMDVTKEEDLQRVVQTIMSEQQRIDVLINNAGMVIHGSVEDTPIEAARRHFDVNVLAPARLVQLVLPYLRQQKSGTIVNVSSIGGEIALPLGAWYYASKHALEAMSDTLRMEVESFGVNVVVIQPGIIRTDFESAIAQDLRMISGDGAYRDMAEAMAKAAEKQSTAADQASSPSVVAEAIRTAIEADRPDTRYVVGWQAEALLNLNRTLSDREFDAAITGGLR